MRVTRIPRIKGYRVFRDFTWPSELQPFAQFNVIYGWNGSGKTAFSTLFEGLQKKQSITEGKVEFEFDTGLKIAGEDIPDNNLPPVRVFNRSFVARTIDSIRDGNVPPIYYLGEESVEQQKQVERLRKELTAAQETLNKADAAKKKAEKKLDAFCIEKAKLIKEALLGSAEHAIYDKRSFRQAVTKMKGRSPQPTALSDEEKKALRKKKELQAKPSISKVMASVPDIDHLRKQTTELLQQTIISMIIDELANDSTVGAWVQQGLNLHKGKRKTDTCRFCGNSLSPERREELEAHFNDAFAAFQKKIDNTASDIKRHRQELEKLEFPDASRFYDHLAGDVQSAVETAKEVIKSVNQVLGSFIDALEQKKAAPFKEVTLQETDTAQGVGDDKISEVVEAVNLIIEKHEETTTNLNGEIKKACSELEQDYVLEALQKYDDLASVHPEIG